MTMPDVALVIPAFNEERTIRDIAIQARHHCPLVIVVDDGSTDNTYAELTGEDLVVLRNGENRGKAASIWRGICYALEQGAQSVITMDADGQHRPEDIPSILRASAEHPGSIVIGARLHEQQNIPRKRYLANRFANFWISWAAGYPIEDSQSGFRLYPGALLSKLELDIGPEKGFVFESEVLIEAAWRGIKSVSVPIPAIYGEELRESHFRSVTDVKRITNTVASRLLQRRMYPRGFYRAFISPRFQKLVRRGFDRDAGAMLVLSGAVALCTVGTGYLWLFGRVLLMAFRAPIEVDPASTVLVPGYRLQEGQIADDYRLRLDRSLEIANQSPIARILILGGRPQGFATEASLGKAYLTAQGFPADRIATEETSLNTLGNLRNARDWMVGQSNIVIVSHRYHLKRLDTIARGLGLHVALCAADPVPGYGKIARAALAEAVFLHWYWVGRGYARLTSNNRILDKLT